MGEVVDELRVPAEHEGVVGRGTVSRVVNGLGPRGWTDPKPGNCPTTPEAGAQRAHSPEAPRKRSPTRPNRSQRRWHRNAYGSSSNRVGDFGGNCGMVARSRASAACSEDLESTVLNSRGQVAVSAAAAAAIVPAALPPPTRPTGRCSGPVNERKAARLRVAEASRVLPDSYRVGQVHMLPTAGAVVVKGFAYPPDFCIPTRARFAAPRVGSRPLDPPFLPTHFDGLPTLGGAITESCG